MNVVAKVINKSRSILVRPKIFMKSGLAACGLAADFVGYFLFSTSGYVMHPKYSVKSISVSRKMSEMRFRAPT